MLELLILNVLSERKSSIYGIKQFIDAKFSLFFKNSFGSIHPALKRLEKDEYVKLKQSLSEGGQKKSEYSITTKGKDYFKELMSEPLPENPTLSSQIINIKLMLLGSFDIDVQKGAVSSILEHYEFQKNKAEAFISLSNVDEYQRKFILHNIEILTKNIEWLELLL